MDEVNKLITPEIVLKLTTKGIYIWQIKLPFGSNVEDEYNLSRLKKIDDKLKDTFPQHARIGSGKVSSFDAFDDI